MTAPRHLAWGACKHSPLQTNPLRKRLGSYRRGPLCQEHHVLEVKKHDAHLLARLNAEG